MKYIHVKNLEKYNPGYKDRHLIWCKIYFSMLNTDYEFDLIDDIDKWRLIALIMLELQRKEYIPYDEKWLQSKISNHKRPISLTLNMLHNFLDIVTEDSEVRNDSVTQNRIDKNRIEYNRIEESRRFTPPTVAEVKEYVGEIGVGIDCEQFVCFYESKGWMVGKNKMKDWKAAVRLWSRRNGGDTNKKVNQPVVTRGSGTDALDKYKQWEEEYERTEEVQPAHEKA